MEDIPLDPVVAQMALPDRYSETMEAFFTDLAEQESGDYARKIKQVLALDYVLLRADVDEQGRSESDRLELTYKIEAVDLDSLTAQNVSGSDERRLPHEEVREEFEFTPMEATFDMFDDRK